MDQLNRDRLQWKREDKWTGNNGKEDGLVTVGQRG